MLFARLFREGEWSIDYDDENEGEWTSADNLTLALLVNCYWDEVETGPEYGFVLDAFVERMAAEFQCEYWVRPEPPLADGEYRIY